MAEINVISLRPPYLVFVADVEETYAKTGFGLVYWRRELCLGQHRFGTAGADLGLPDMTPTEAAKAGAGSLIVSVAPVGGRIPDSWVGVLLEGAEAGLDIVSGLHSRLSDIPELVAAAEQTGVRLLDVRRPPAGLPVGTGKRRTGRRLLTVGTDCAVGKKYTALSIEREMLSRGFNATFRATGQTGIMIAGTGLPIDAVVSDFVSGAAELLSPDNDPDHWDIIEGQGAIFHPGYAAVSFGLILGSQPDAIIVCHEANRQEILGWPGFSIPSMPECIERNLLEGSVTNPDIQCVGVCVNTSVLPVAERSAYLAALSAETGFPCVDPIADGCDAIVDNIRTRFS